MHGAIEEVLSREEFLQPTPGWIERLRRELVDAVEQVLGALVDGGRGTLLAWVILVASILAIALVVSRFARGVTRDPGRAVSAVGIARKGAADWRADAEAAERAGNWALAMRCHYRALVAELADRGLVEDLAGRTAGEYRADVSGAVPSVGATFAGATELFERAWYGDRPPGEDDAVRLRALADDVLAGLGR